MKKLFLLPFFAFFCSTQLSAQSFPILLDSPRINGSVSGGTISISLYNAVNSNNYNEVFNVYDPRIQNAPDTSWDFEGYIIYQVDSCEFPTPIEYFGYDTNYVRQIAQCDLANGITTLINHDSTNSCAAKTMVVGADAGTQYNYVFTIDAFTGQPFQPGREYTFTAIAYGHNAHFSDSSCAPLTSPFLRGVHQHFFCAQLTGMKELQSDFSPLTVFPSPAKTDLTVDLSAFHSDVAILIYDISGQLVSEQAANGTSSCQLNISELAPGIYFIKALSTESAQMTRFIKE